MSGKFLGLVRANSGNCPGDAREISKNFAGHLREMSGTFSEQYFLVGLPTMSYETTEFPTMFYNSPRKKLRCFGFVGTTLGRFGGVLGKLLGVVWQVVVTFSDGFPGCFGRWLGQFFLFFSFSVFGGKTTY